MTEPREVARYECERCEAYVDDVHYSEALGIDICNNCANAFDNVRLAEKNAALREEVEQLKPAVELLRGVTKLFNCPNTVRDYLATLEPSTDREPGPFDHWKRCAKTLEGRQCIQESTHVERGTDCVYRYGRLEGD